MYEYIKNYFAIIVFSGLFFLMGLAIGLTAQEDGHGIYFSANYPDGHQAFVIGKNIVDVETLDIQGLDDMQSTILASKISGIGGECPLGQALRNMAKKNSGPFHSITVDVRMHLTDDDKVAGPAVKACKNTPIYGNSFIAYQVRGLSTNKPNAIKLTAVWEEISGCAEASHAGDPLDVWVNRKYIENHMGPIDANASVIQAKANIYIADLSI